MRCPRYHALKGGVRKLLGGLRKALLSFFIFFQQKLTGFSVRNAFQRSPERRGGGAWGLLKIYLPQVPDASYTTEWERRKAGERIVLCQPVGEKLLDGD